jgi:hypothetical protein
MEASCTCMSEGTEEVGCRQALGADDFTRRGYCQALAAWRLAQWRTMDGTQGCYKFSLLTSGNMGDQGTWGLI